MESSDRDTRTSASGSLSASDQCDLLSSRRRRRLLSYLIENPNEPIAVGRLITHLQSVKEDAESENIRLALKHVHLPKLERVGIIAYTADEDTVEYRSHDQLEELLAFLKERD